MTLLMPGLERQLRTVVRAHQDAVARPRRLRHLFIQALPDSACNHKSLTMTARGRLTPHASVTDIATDFFGACGPNQLVEQTGQEGQSSRPGPKRGSPGSGNPSLPVQPPAGLSPAARAEFLNGRTVAANAPLRPAAPMPSFRGLSRRRLEQLVDFLSQLRGGH